MKCLGYSHHFPATPREPGRACEARAHGGGGGAKGATQEGGAPGPGAPAPTPLSKRDKHLDHFCGVAGAGLAGETQMAPR
jgi:hypothetical protein